MRVRRATPDDVDDIATLAELLFVEDSGTRDPHADTSWPTSPDGRAHYSHHVTDVDSCVLVAGAPALGFLVGHRRPRNPLRPRIAVADLQVMYVRPEHRSSGMGAALLDSFRAWAHARDIDILSVTAAASNDAALRFYESHGFTPRTFTLEVPPHVDHAGSAGRSASNAAATVVPRGG